MKTTGDNIKQPGRNIRQQSDPGDAGTTAAWFNGTEELIAI
jgi:hypothetical protein